MVANSSGKFKRGNNPNIKTFGDFADSCAYAWQGETGRHRQPDRAADDLYLKKIVANRGKVKSLSINDPMTRSALDYRVQLAVGTTVRIKPNVMWEHLRWTAEENRRVRKELKTYWKMFMESDERWIDATGRGTISEMAAQHTRIYSAEGEAMAAIFELGPNRRSPLSFALGNIDPDRVRTPTDLPKDQLSSVHDGILKSLRNYHLGYYVHDFHRRDSRAQNVTTDNYRLIPTRNPETGREQFIHSFAQITSDLSRGISQLASVLNVSCQKDQYLDAALEDAISKAGLTFVVTSNASSLTDLMGVLSNQSEDLFKDYMNKSKDWHEGLEMRHKGNRLARLMHGEGLDGFSADQAGGATFEVFNDALDMIAASAQGLSVEEYLQKWDKTNFSGARSGKLYVWNMIKALRQQAPWRFVRKAYCLFFEDMVLQGYIRLPNTESAQQSWEFFLANKEALCCVEFFGSPKDEIDLAKTADYYLSLRELGIYTHESICNELLNEDWEDRLDQIIEEVKTTFERLVECGQTPTWTIADEVTRRLSGISATVRAAAPVTQS